MHELLTPGFYAVITPLLIAAVIFGRDWLTKNSLKLTLENIDLNADIAAKQAEAVAKELVVSQKVQRDQAEALVAQALILGQVAQDTAEAKVIQAATGAKVDGQMTELHRKIAELSNALVAAKQDQVNEKEKASTLAVQTEKDRGEAAAKLAAAQQAPPQGSPQTGQLPAVGQEVAGQAVTIPEITVAVEEAKPKPLLVMVP